MFPLNCALAVALLTAPSGTTESAFAGEELATVRTTLQKVAISWEILDSREVRYVLTRPEDFAADLKLLRRRYQELSDAPPLCDCIRFPDRYSRMPAPEVSTLFPAFTRSYCDGCEAREPAPIPPKL